MSTSFNEFFEDKMKNSEFKAAYEELEPEFNIIQAMIDARKEAGLTQKQLAEKTGIAQGDISKLEHGNGNPSLKTLKRLAEGLNLKLKIELI